MSAPWRGLRTRDHLALPLRNPAGPTDMCRCCYGAVDAGWYRPGSCALSTCCPPAEYALEDQRLALSERDHRVVPGPLFSRGSSDLPLQVVGCDVGCSCHGVSRRLFKSRRRLPRDERRPWLGVAGCIAVRRKLTWQHPDIWDAVRVALIVAGVFARSAGASYGSCEDMHSAHLAACAGRAQMSARSKASFQPCRLGRQL